MKVKKRVGKNEESIELIIKAQNGCLESRNRVVELNQGLAQQIASKYISTRNDAEDILQIGYLALIKAVERFDVTKNIKFSTFAYTCIQGEVLNHFRDYSLIQKKKVSNYLFKKVQDYQFEYYKEHGEFPTTEMISEKIGANIKDIEIAIYESQPIGSLSDKPFGQDDGDKEITMADMIANKIEDDYDNVIIQESIKAILNEEQVKIFNLSLQGDSKRDIAKQLGKSEAGIRLELNKIVKKLSQNFLKYSLYS